MNMCPILIHSTSLLPLVRRLIHRCYQLAPCHRLFGLHRTHLRQKFPPPCWIARNSGLKNASGLSASTRLLRPKTLASSPSTSSDEMQQNVTCSPSTLIPAILPTPSPHGLGSDRPKTATIPPMSPLRPPHPSPQTEWARKYTPRNKSTPSVTRRASCMFLG
ncbi:hypothetical protein K438DRAFT_1857238 [Mycena galopus ATCC 62051]|nr:hypothetical protein K438DRAFT_1857238 [Mycena galopus ATCC 62051]